MEAHVQLWLQTNPASFYVYVWKCVNLSWYIIVRKVLLTEFTKYCERGKDNEFQKIILGNNVLKRSG
jgi:hypothetical protein